MAFTLRAATGSLASKKISVAAELAGVQLKVENSKNAVPELSVANGEATVKYTPAILRYVARVTSPGLYGRNYFESSQVDQWLDYTANEIDGLMDTHALLKGKGPAPAELEGVVQAVNGHMLDKTFLTGHGISVADVSMAASLHAPLTALAPQWQSKYTAAYRWFNTCAHQPAFAKAFGTAAPAGGKADKQQAGAKGGKSAPAEGGKAPAAVGTVVPVAEYGPGGRLRVGAILQAADSGKSRVGQVVTVCGWSRTVRKQGGGKFCFVELNDGSCLKSLQVIVDESIPGYDRLLKCGPSCSFRFRGLLVDSPAAGQPVELAVKDAARDSMTIYGEADAGTYPLAKKGHSMEFLREMGHLRPRTNLIGAVARVRSALAMATHRFFQDRGFLYVHTPIITASDCEGAGEMFQVTTVLPDAHKGKLTEVPADKKTGTIDYSKDFFTRPAFLTVSGQLAVENYCCALSSVYTFGPTFRAERSHTSRHLAEFWMIEPELAFADLSDDMECAEAYLKSCVQWALDNCAMDLQFFDERVEKGLVERLRNIIAEPFARISYTEAIELIKPHAKEFENKDIHWGMDMASEHERYITEKIYKKPVIVYNYPKEIKAFYMRVNEDQKTVAAMDVLVPKIGEVIGGSQREERLDVLDRRIKEMNLEIEAYWWYRDLRKYGTVPHAGFGLGFERLLMLVTGLDNIRDVIPYPRYPGHADF